MKKEIRGCVTLYRIKSNPNQSNPKANQALLSPTLPHQDVQQLRRSLPSAQSKWENSPQLPSVWEGKGPRLQVRSWIFPEGCLESPHCGWGLSGVQIKMANTPSAPVKSQKQIESLF